MTFAELVDLVQDLPLFRGSLLLVGDRDPADVRRQLVRWTNTGKITQLRRNLYVLADPWRRTEPHPFVVANHLRHHSYVSLQSALAYFDLIPEAVPATVSVTTGRPATVDTPLGRYMFRHIDQKAFFGYGPETVHADQKALVATPSKALLDLCYLTPRGDDIEYLRSLRLEELESVPADALQADADRWSKPKVRRAARALIRLATDRAGETR